MKKKRVLLSTLALSMSLAAAPALAADFVDMPDDYSTESLQAAVDNNLLNGDGDLINPDGDLTRSEFAAIMVRAFGATNEADISDYTDVNSDAWYAEYIAKAVAMGIMEGDGTVINPTAAITRQEVCTVLARAFSMDSDSDISEFNDSDAVSAWAYDSVAAMIDAEYILGADGNINPKDNIVRKDFAVIIDRMVGHYVSDSSHVDDYVEGTMLIQTADAILDGMTITGDLIIADGVNLADLDLSNVTVEGDIIIRSAGDVTLTDVSANNVKVASVSTETTVSVAGESTIESVVSVANNATVVVSDNATVTKVEVSGENATVTVTGTATVESVATTGESTTVSVADEATVESVATTGDDTTVKVSDEASVSDVEIAGSDSEITVSDNATVENATVSGDDSTVEVTDSANVDSVVADGSGTTVTGDGSVDSVEVNGDDTSVDTNGTDVSVSDNATGTTVDGESVDPGSSTSTSSSSSSSSSGGSSSTYYTVAFDDQDSDDTTSVASQKVKKGNSVTFSTPTRTGYTFLGWATTATGDVAYTDGDTFAPSSATTFYAIWAETYTVTFDYNYEGETDTTSSIEDGDYVTFAEPTARTGYTFLGWNTAANGSGDTYTADETFAPTTATTFYAIWGYEVDSANDLSDAIAANATNIIVTGDFSTTTALSIPEGTNLIINKDVTLTIDANNLTIGGTITNNGTIKVETNGDNLATVLSKVDSGNVEISDAISVSGDITVKDGVTLKIPYNNSLTFASGADLTIDGTISNYGTITVNDETVLATVLSNVNSGDVALNSTVVVTGELTVPTDVELNVGVYTLFVNGTLTNNGDISIAGTGAVYYGSLADGSGKFSGSGTYAAATFYNNGDTLSSDLETGNYVINSAVTINGEITVDGDLAIAPKGSLTVSYDLTVNGDLRNCGTLTVDTNQTLTVKGTLSNDGTIYVSGTIKVNDADSLTAAITGATSGTIEVTADITTTALTVPSGVTLTVAADTNLFVNGDLTATGAITNNGTIYASGTVTNNGNITNSSSGTIYYGTLDGTISGGTATEATFYTTTVPNSTLSSGTAVIIDDVNMSTLTVSDTGTLVIAPGCTLTVDSADDLIVNGGTITNYGSITVQAKATNLKTVLDAVNSGTVNVSDYITTADALTVAENVTLNIGSGAKLTVTSDLTVSGTLTNNGAIAFDSGTLTVNENGTIDNNGTIYVSTAANLQTVLSKVTSGTVTIIDDITLTDAITIPEGVTLTIDRADGSLSNNSSDITVEGTLYNNGTITLGSGNFVVSGADSVADQYTWSTIEIAYDNSTNLTTALDIGGNVLMTADVTVSDDLTIPTGTTLTVDYGTTLAVTGDLTITGTLNEYGTVSVTGTTTGTVTKPDYNEITSVEMLNAWVASTETAGTITEDFATTGALTIANGKTLTIASGKTLTLGANLTVGGDTTGTLVTEIIGTTGGTLVISDDVTLTVTDGTLTNNGNIYVSDGTNLATVLGNITSGKVYMTADATIDTLTVPENVTLYIQGSNITVSVTGTLTANGDVDVSGGTLTVENLTIGSGATVQTSTSTVDSVSLTGAITLTGTVTNNGTLYASKPITLGASCTLTGDGAYKTNAGDGFVVNTGAQLEALNDYANTQTIYITVDGTVEVNDTLELSEYVNLTVSTGATLTVTGNLSTAFDQMYNYATKITNNGTIEVTGTLSNSGTITNSGTIYYGSLSSGSNAIDDGTDGSSGVAATEVDTWDDLNTALTNNKTAIIITDDITLGDDIEIPADTTLTIDEEKTLTLTSDYGITVSGTLTNNGIIKVYTDTQLTTALAATTSSSKGTVVVAGNIGYSTGSVTVPTGGTLTIANGATLTISGSNASGTYYKLYNNGTVEVEAGGKIVIASNGINNGTTAVIDNYGTIEITTLNNSSGSTTNHAGATLSVSYALSGGGGTITNNGTIKADGSSLTTAGGTITNSGTIFAGTVTTTAGTIANSGVLSVTGAITNKGTVTIKTGGVIFANDTITNGESTSNSSGTFEIKSGGILYANGAVTNTVNYGTFSNNGTIYYNGTAPTGTYSGDNTQTPATFYSSGTIDNALAIGTHVIIGDVPVSSEITNSGDLVIAPSGKLTVDSSITLTIANGATLTNYGSVVGGSNSSKIDVTSSGTVTGVTGITDGTQATDTYYWVTDTWSTNDPTD